MMIILMGVTGSGKTTIGRLLARDLGWPFYDGDDFHPAANVEKMRSGIPLNDADRAGWLAALRALIQQKIEAGQPAILACSALKQKYREQLQQDHEHEISFVYLKGDYDLIEKRLQARRGHFMNPRLLASQFEALEEPQGVLTIDIATAPAIIVAGIKRALRLA